MSRVDGRPGPASPAAVRPRPTGTAWGPWLWLAAVLSASACQSSTRSPLSPGSSLGTPSAFASQVQLVKLEGRPDLAVVEREGDPSPVLGVLLHANTQDQAALAGFAELSLAALRGAGATARARVDRSSILLDVDAQSGAGRDVLRAAVEALDRLLHAPVRLTDAAALQQALATRLASIAREPHAIASRARACVEQAGFDASQAAQLDSLELGSKEGAARIEAVRAQLAPRSAVTFAIVGPPSARTAAEAALRGTSAWPEGEPSGTASFRADSEAQVAAFAVPGATRARVTVALPTTSPLSAIAAAEALGRAPSALGARAERRGFRLLRSVGVARTEGGGCVSVTLEGRPPASKAEADQRGFDQAIEELTAVSLREIEREVGSGAEASLDMPGRILQAETASASAQLAVWWARSRPLADALGDRRGATVAVAVPAEVSTGPQGSLLRALEAGMAAPKDDARANVERVAVRLERGQAQSWVLVMDPCAPLEEPAHRWGLSALAALAATPKAQAAARLADIEVEPLVGPGVGFVAHAAPRSAGEQPADLVRRVARAAMASFFVEPASGDELLFAEEAALGRLTQRWSRDAPGLVALTRPTNNPPLPDHPTLLEPFGLPSRVARFESSELARRLRASTEGPLAVALLARDDADDERAAAQEEIARWLGPARRKACKDVEPYAHRGARVEVRESRKGPVVLRMLLALDASVPHANEHARVVTALLGGAEGLLAKAVSAGPNMRVEAQLSESTATLQLVLTIVGSEESVVAAEPLALDLLKRLARGELPDGVIARGIAARTQALRTLSADPRTRLLAALDQETRGPTPELTPSEVRDYVKRALVPDEAFIVLSRPDT